MWTYTFTHTQTHRVVDVFFYLPHRRVWLWWCQRPAQGNRNTWRFESALQSYSYYSSDGWPPPHMSPASPGMRLRGRERKRRGEGDYLLEIHRLSWWLIGLWQQKFCLDLKKNCAATNNQIYTTTASLRIKQICWIIYFCINSSIYSSLILFDS